MHQSNSTYNVDMLAFAVYIVGMVLFLVWVYVFLSSSTHKMMKKKLKEVGVLEEFSHFLVLRILLAVLLGVFFL